MNKKGEKNRKLSKKEQERLRHFEEVSSSLEEKGYRKSNLTVGIVFANVVVLAAAIPVFAVGMGLYFLVNREFRGIAEGIPGLILFFVLMLVMVVIHELVHGITWSIFSEHHFRDIEFGVMWDLLTPYCTCKVPLSKGAYITGALMPLIVLGILPAAIGIALGWPGWLFMGLIMTLSAGGDVLIVLQVLKHRSSAEDILYFDYPTQAGLAVFEK